MNCIALFRYGRRQICVLNILMCMAVVACHNNISEKKTDSSGAFDYLGQNPPGDSAIVFAPGIISDTGTRESALAISPKGDELFFAKGVWPETKIMHMVKSEGNWSMPDTAFFCSNSWATEPAFSPDGQYLYFSSSKGESDIKFYSLWRMVKERSGWSEPEKLFSNNSDSIWEFHPAVADNGILYFCYWNVKKQSGDIYMSQCSDSRCSDPVRLDFPVSSDSSDVDPFVWKDGSYLIFSTNRAGGNGGLDQYITFKNNDGSWSPLENLGMQFNSAEDDYDLDITPDGSFCIIYQNNDIYWMRNSRVR